ncbi:reverse gyrase [compost metagenome]
MRPLSDYATTLFLALAARHVCAEPMLADAAAIIAGRIRKWSIWETLPESQQTLIAQGLRLRPSMLAQPKRFMTSAEAILKSDMSPFELVNSTNLGFELHERDRYRVSSHLDVDHLIRENFEALKNGRPATVPAQIPETGDVVLKHITGDQIRVFQIPEAERGALSTLPQHINIAPSLAVPDMCWDYESLAQLAQQLDLESGLHSQHTASLRNIWGHQATREAKSGSFYRVNAPTGAGKSVVMLIMAIDAARRGHKVVIAVPSLVDLQNTVQALKQSASVTAKDLRIAPLHSASRIHERAELHFAQHRVDHPYDYTCLLNAYSADLKAIEPGSEPCFNVQVSTIKNDDSESSKRLKHCPFLFQCGQTRMLSQAIEANIVVINHHALLSGNTRIPLSDADQFPGPRSLIEILLRTSPVFLVDEIDALLKSAIDSSVIELQLGNLGDNSPLLRLFNNVVSRTKIPGIDRSSLFRLNWALTYCTLSVSQLMNLQQERYFEWPVKETTWPEANDSFIMQALGIERDTLEHLFSNNVGRLPSHLEPVSRNLANWRTNDGEHKLETLATELGHLITSLSANGQLLVPLKEDERVRLKASLILRGTLSVIETHLRNLQIELPAFVNAEIPYAYEVRRSITGPEPLSPSPNGPLQRAVFGFKRKDGSADESTLNVVAMRGDPHGTLLSLPDVSALGYAGVKRLFIGFSATAYFPGASSFDLKALDLIDVPDAKGQVTFRDVNLTTAISGAPYFERKYRVTKLAKEIWPWVKDRLQCLSDDPVTKDRARLLLVTNSDTDAEALALELVNMQGGPGQSVGWVRGRRSEFKPSSLSNHHTLIYDDLAEFTTGKHKDKTVLVSALGPMARGHNIVNADGLSAIGGVVICVRPLPSSDSPNNNLAHICYETGNTVLPGLSPGEVMMQERNLSNDLLQRIRTSPPAFSQQPHNIRHYTIMNILVSLTQLIGRGRRGGTPVTCYFADAAFLAGRTTWPQMLADSVARLRRDGDWEQFELHHAGIATAVQQYIILSSKEAR